MHSVTIKTPTQLNGIFLRAVTSLVCLWHHSASAYTFCPLFCFWRDTKANKNRFSKQVNPMCSAACQEWHRHNITLQMKGWKSRETLKWLSKQKSLLAFRICKKGSASDKRNISKIFWLQKSDRKEKKTEPGVCVVFLEDTLPSHSVLTTGHFYLS